MAPAVSTLSKPVRDAWDDVARKPNNLLSGDVDSLKRFRFVCPEFGDGSGAEPRPNPRGTVKGVWREATGRKLVLPLIGVVDAANSKIGSYGNLDKNFDPTLKKLKAAKFMVALKFPDFSADHPDVAYADGVINQMARLSDMQKVVNSRVAEASRYNNAARFSDNNGDLSGCMVTTLGSVFVAAARETTAEEFLKRSPTKPKATPTTPPPPNIVDDPKYYTQCIDGADGLKHNDLLPIRFSDGTRVGRTGEELTRELTDGRWVRADCELLVWNMTDETSTVRTFSLAVENMVVLPRLPAVSILEGGKGLEGKGLSYAAMTKADMLSGATTGGSGASPGKLDGDATVESGSDKTLSSDDGPSDKSSKRARDDAEGESPTKKQKQTPKGA